MSRRAIREANNPNYDARSDLGYGRDGHFSIPRGGQTTWPYIEPVRFDVDDEDDLEDEEEIRNQVALVNKAGLGHIRQDAYAKRSSDHRRYVGPDFRMYEQTTGRSISPMPDLYKGKEVMLGVGADGPAIRPAPARISLAGSKAGYSSAYPLRDLGSNEPAYTLQDIPSPDEMTLHRLRRLIRAIHNQQEIENSFE